MVTSATRASRAVAAAGVLAPILLASCATYADRTNAALQDFRSGRFEEAATEFRDPETMDCAFLAGAEAGTVSMTAGDWDGALNDLHRAAAASKDIEGRALAGPETFGETLGSWTLNDSTRAYQGEGFERVYVHSGLAMAYLARFQLDDAYVEARLANRLLEAEEQLYDKSYRAGGWGHLISALAYELSGEPGEAYIDYVRMIEKDVGSEVAGPALVRLARQLRRDDDLERWVENHDDGGWEAAGLGEAASIVVLAGVGLGPEKVEGRLIIALPDGVAPFSGVKFRRRPQRVSHLEVTADGSTSQTHVIESVSGVAAENLEDRQVWQVVRSVARGVLKLVVTKKLEDEYGLAGRVAGDVFAVLSERADLRAWRTLPDSWQAVRHFVRPGVHPITLTASGGDTVELGTFELGPGETLLVYARTLDSRVYAHTIGGRPIEDEEDQGPGDAPSIGAVLPEEL